MARTLLLILLLVAVGLVALSMMGSPASHATTFSLSLAASSPVPIHSAGRVAAPDRSSSSILGRPSLSVAFINRVLSAYHSPAAGLGSVLYADSLTYGIDDAYPLAFFLHESSMGNAGWAEGQSLSWQHSVYGWLVVWWWLSLLSTWAAGFHDWFTLIVNEYLPRHLSTIATIIPVYAPSADHNDEHAYITAVLLAVSAWRTGRMLV